MALVVFSPFSVPISAPSASESLQTMSTAAGTSFDAVSSVLDMSPAFINALPSSRRILVKVLRKACMDAFVDFEAAMVYMDNETTSEELLSALHMHPGLFLTFMDALVQGRPRVVPDSEKQQGLLSLNVFLSSIDPAAPWEDATALNTALDASYDDIGGSFKDWLLALPADVFERFWFAGKKLCKSQDCTGCPRCKARPALSMHAAKLLSGYPEFRSKLDADCPDVARKVKGLIKRTLLDGDAWDRQDSDHERWFCGGKCMDELDAHEFETEFQASYSSDTDFAETSDATDDSSSRFSDMSAGSKRKRATN